MGCSLLCNVVKFQLKPNAIDPPPTRNDCFVDYTDNLAGTFACRSMEKKSGHLGCAIVVLECSAAQSAKIPCTHSVRALFWE
jgi:hypothetical protein